MIIAYSSIHSSLISNINYSFIVIFFFSVIRSHIHFWHEHDGGKKIFMKENMMEEKFFYFHRVYKPTYSFSCRSVQFKSGSQQQKRKPFPIDFSLLIIPNSLKRKKSNNIVRDKYTRWRTRKYLTSFKKKKKISYFFFLSYLMKRIRTKKK